MLENYKKIHFVGVGGIGISALAKLAILEGAKVSGSDLTESEITKELEEMGAKIFLGHKKTNVPKGVDLIIYSDAVPKDSPERTLFYPSLNKGGHGGVMSYFEALGEITKTKKTIAVSGTNGKSTTTAMLGKILIDAGLDPLVIVGSKYSGFNHGNLHYGKGEYFVLEACEHNAHMLRLSPWSIVLTNIEADHLDFYKNLENILKAFKKYIGKIGLPACPAKPDLSREARRAKWEGRSGGFLVYNADDKNTKLVVPEFAGIKKILYGVYKNADVKFEERQIGKGFQKFDLSGLGEVKLKIPGLFNVYNTLAAIAAARELGVEFRTAAKSVSEFYGLWRRFEKIGEFKKAPIISDYGHHPTAVAATILAAREFYPDSRLVVAFEPHQHHRTKALFADFVRSFDEADVLVLSEIYNVAGRVKNSDRDVSSRKLGEAIVKYWESDENTKEIEKHKLIYCENLKETEDALKSEIKKNDVVLIMGAGDIYKVADKICSMQ